MPMGHIAHFPNNSYKWTHLRKALIIPDYTITLIKRENNITSSLNIECILFVNVRFLYRRMLFVKFCWFCPSGSGEDFHISSMYFRYFLILSSLKRMWSFIWTKINSPYPGMLRSMLGYKLALWFCMGRIY